MLQYLQQGSYDYHSFVLYTEAEGFWFGSNYGLGIAVLELRPPKTTNKDEIAFGFMTWGDSGTLLRADGDASSEHFIQAHLVLTYQFILDGYWSYLQARIATKVGGVRAAPPPQKKNVFCPKIEISIKHLFNSCHFTICVVT